MRPIFRSRTPCTYLTSDEPASLGHLQAEYVALARHRHHRPIAFHRHEWPEVVRVDRQGDTVALVPPEQLQNRADEPLHEGNAEARSRADLRLRTGTQCRARRDRAAGQAHACVVGVPVFDGTGAKRGIIIINYLGQRILTAGELRDAALPTCGRQCAGLLAARSEGRRLRLHVSGPQGPDLRRRLSRRVAADADRAGGKVESDPGRFLLPGPTWIRPTPAAPVPAQLVRPGRDAARILRFPDERPQVQLCGGGVRPRAARRHFARPCSASDPSPRS